MIPADRTGKTFASGSHHSQCSIKVIAFQGLSNVLGELERIIGILGVFLEDVSHGHFHLEFFTMDLYAASFQEPLRASVIPFFIFLFTMASSGCGAPGGIMSRELLWRKCHKYVGSSR